MADDLSNHWGVVPYRPTPLILRPQEFRKGKTFRDAAESYMKHRGHHKLIARVTDVLGDVLLEEIVPFDIIEMANVMRPDLTNATKNRHFLGPIRTVLNHAYQKRWCDYLQIKALKEDTPKEKVPPTPLWMSLFFRQCEKEKAHHLAALVMFMSTTGARISEAINLKWPEVDLDNRAALLLKTKTEKNSQRFLTNAVVRRLRGLKDNPPTRNRDRVFGYKCRWSVNDRIFQICEHAEIEYHTSHEVGRVFYATTAIALGLDIPTIMKGGGWKSMVVFSRYAKPGQLAGMRVADRFNELQTDTRA